MQNTNWVKKTGDGEAADALAELKLWYMLENRNKCNVEGGKLYMHCDVRVWTLLSDGKKLIGLLMAALARSSI